jgi:hypothetical protein
MLRLASLALAAALGALPASGPIAPGPSGPPHRAAADVRLVGEALDGSTVEVGIAKLPIAALDELGVVLLRIEGGSAPAAAERTSLAGVTLAGGERVAGQIAGGAGEVLSLRLFGDVVLPIRVGALRALVFDDRIPEGRTEPLAAPAEFDRLYRRVGAALDTIDGTFEEFTAEGVRFDSRRLGSRLIPWAEVAALFVEVLEDAVAPEEAGAAVRIVVDLADGGRLRGRMRGLSSAGLDLVVGGANAIHLPLEVLAEIAVDDGRIAFVSDLRPAREAGRGNPFPGDEVGMMWPVRADRAVTGGLLRAGGRVWRRGLGVQAPTAVTYDLGGAGGAWRELRGAVAIDDSVLLEPAKGSVVFRIRLDGATAWESPVLAAGDAPLAFPPLALAGKRELVLEADMSTELNQGDRADWLRMLLVR